MRRLLAAVALVEETSRGIKIMYVHGHDQSVNHFEHRTSPGSWAIARRIPMVESGVQDEEARPSTRCRRECVRRAAADVHQAAFGDRVRPHSSPELRTFDAPAMEAAGDGPAPVRRWLGAAGRRRSACLAGGRVNHGPFGINEFDFLTNRGASCRSRVTA
jgi:hypothetical protein